MMRIEEEYFGASWISVWIVPLTRSLDKWYVSTVLVPLHCIAKPKPFESALVSLSVQPFLMLSAFLYWIMVSSRKASKSTEATQVRLLMGVSLKAELRASVSYMPGVNVGFGSSSGTDVCARASEASATMMHADETSRRCTGTGGVFRRVGSMRLSRSRARKRSMRNHSAASIR